jgi:hypothetical protein
MWRSRSIRGAALLVALAGFSGADDTDKNISRHLKRLKSKSAFDRMIGVDGLAAIGAPAAHTVPLLLPLLRDPDPAVRGAVARALPQIVPDQSEAPLFETARNDTDRDVRQAATEGLRDETHVAEIVHAEADASVRRQAAKRVKDAKLLAALAGDKDAGTRRAVLAHMDQDAIARLARELTSAEARRDAIGALERPEVLADIAKRDPDASVREWARLVSKTSATDDVRLDKLDCERVESTHVRCRLTIVNRGAAAYLAAAYVSSSSSVGIRYSEHWETVYFDSALQPGATQTVTVSKYAFSGQEEIVFRVKGVHRVPAAAARP